MESDDIDNPDEVWSEMVGMVNSDRASVFIDDTPWGLQARIKFADSPKHTVSPEEHQIKKVLTTTASDALVRMDDAPSEEWDSILNDENIPEDKREDIKTIAHCLG